MKVGNHIFHVRVVHRPLRLTAPRGFGGSIIRVNPDNMEIVGMFEFMARRVFHPTAKNQMQFAHGDAIG